MDKSVGSAERIPEFGSARKKMLGSQKDYSREGRIMQAALLQKIFGKDRRWRGPCTVIVDADASIQTTGVDSIVQSGVKVYAPRLISGRVAADAACLFTDGNALVLVQTLRIRQATGEDLHQQTVVLVNLDHIVAIEFSDTSALSGLDIEPPPVSTR
jgi:hypothetical protein